MANLECRECGDLVDVEARSVVLPFTCKWCQEGFEAKPAPSYSIQCRTYRVPPHPTLSILSPSSVDTDLALILDLREQLAEANRNVECWKAHYAVALTDVIIADARAKDSEAKSASLATAFMRTERLYFVERNRTWWERLWA
jgi:hypothetical protein